jgi:hypothetical protein
MHYAKEWMLLWKSSSRQIYQRRHGKVHDTILMQKQSYWTKGGATMRSIYVEGAMNHTLEGQLSVRTNNRVSQM